MRLISHNIAPHVYADPTYRGLGALGDATAQQINAIVTTGASTTVGILAALSVVTGPIGAAIAGLVAVGSLIANVFQGCGQTCTVASNDANQIEAALKQNLQVYLSSPVRTQSMQAAALNNFNTVWQALVSACSNPALGKAGQNCVSERQSGACAYKTSPGGWTQSGGAWTYAYPGTNGSGSACWNWFVGYHDPIANDPGVVSDSAVTAATASAASTTTATSSAAPGGAALSANTPGAFFSDPLLLALAGVAAFLLLGGD